MVALKNGHKNYNVLLTSLKNLNQDSYKEALLFSRISKKSKRLITNVCKPFQAMILEIVIQTLTTKKNRKCCVHPTLNKEIKPMLTIVVEYSI